MKEKNVLIISSESLPLLYNRGDLPTRIHIVPRGELVNKEAGVVQVLDQKALDSIVDNLRADAEKRGDEWPGLFMGEEHFIYNSDRSSEAFAWAKRFEVDDKGIWALGPEVTDVGEPALKNKRFKFTSFVTDPAVPGSIEKLPEKSAEGLPKVRILRIDTVGFTNYANGRHLLTPVTNRDRDFRRDPSGDPAGNQNQNQRTMTMKTIANRLGLSAEASEEAILAEVTKLQNRVQELTPHEEQNTQLKNRITALEGEQVIALLDLHGVTDEKARARLQPVLGPMKNREERVAALIDFGFKPIEKKETPAAQRRLQNRDGSQPHGGSQGTANAEQETATRIENRAGELMKGGMDRDQAWAKARQECTK